MLARRGIAGRIRTEPRSSEMRSSRDCLDSSSRGAEAQRDWCAHGRMSDSCGGRASGSHELTAGSATRRAEIAARLERIGDLLPPRCGRARAPRASTHERAPWSLSRVPMPGGELWAFCRPRAIVHTLHKGRGSSEEGRSIELTAPPRMPSTLGHGTGGTVPFCGVHRARGERGGVRTPDERRRWCLLASAPPQG